MASDVMTIRLHLPQIRVLEVIADELRSRSLATPLRSPQELARVGSFLSTISASNSDAEQACGR